MTVDIAFKEGNIAHAPEIYNIVRGCKLDGVESGCAVTQHSTPNMSVDVASGTVWIGSSKLTIAATTKTINAADPSNPRIDIITVDSSGNVNYTAGTASSTPAMPDIPANSILLAMIYVQAGATAIYDSDIRDERVYVPLHNPLSAFLYGLGYDGDITYSTDTTLSNNIFARNLTVNSGVTLKPYSYVIHASEKITINGTISADGGNGANGASGGAGGTIPPDADNAYLPWSIRGGNGGNNAPGEGITITNYVGAKGGNGGSRYSYSGGIVSDAAPLFHYLFKKILPVYILQPAAKALRGTSGSGWDSIRISVGGGGGAGWGTSQTGGGGGAGGGLIVMCAPTIEITSTGIITAKGGNGGAGTANDGGGGGGGGGGIVFLICDTLINSGTINVSGGSGGAGYGAGQNGENGYVVWYKPMTGVVTVL